MQKGEYIVIKVADIEKKINTCKQFIKEFPDTSTGMRLLVAIYQSLLSNPKDLYDVVDNIFTDARAIDPKKSNDFIYENEEDYLNNLEL